MKIDKNKNDFYLVAKIASLSPKDRLLKLDVFTDFSERLLSLENIYVDFFGNKKKIKVEEIFKKGDSFFIKFSGFSTERELQVFLNRELFVDKKNLVKLPENKFFVHDLVNCKVLCSGKLFGTVKEVISTPANDVLEIIRSDGTTIMLPFVLKFYDVVDVQKKVIKIDPKSGLCDYEN